MINEKSCGALVYRRTGQGHELLLIRHRHGGHWAFPKGHVEEGETESETALREIWEETGLRVELCEGFRESVRYCPKAGVEKEVVYFLAAPQKDDTVRIQKEEVLEYTWTPLEKATEEVTFENDKRLIGMAKGYLQQKAGRDHGI